MSKPMAFDKSLIVVSDRGISAEKPSLCSGPTNLMRATSMPVIAAPSAPVFDIERMQRALSAPTIRIPPGLSQKEIREYILSTAKPRRK